MAAQAMMLPRRMWSMMFLFSGIWAAVVKQDPKSKTMGNVVDDNEPMVLDFSSSPFIDSLKVNLASADPDPYKANSKNGTGKAAPWTRWTKVAGRGKADHPHFAGLTAKGDFPADMLEAHNVVRERAGISALKWSDGLAEMAQARVLKLANEGCYIQHSGYGARSYEHGFEYIGENLYKVINMKPTGVDIVDAWYAELEDYSFGQVGTQCVKAKCAGRASPPCTLGHFTQVMWGKSSHVGCGRAECPNQAKRTFISVCNYGEGGNIGGQYPFTNVQAKGCGLEEYDCRFAKEHEPSVVDKVKSKLRGVFR